MSERNRGGQAKKRSNKNRKRSGQDAAQTQAAARDFWGDTTQLPTIDRQLHIASDPAAVVRSLGRPPLAGHETIAEHYFRAVYDRAVTLASALAAAGDLIEPEELIDATE